MSCSQVQRSPVLRIVVLITHVVQFVRVVVRHQTLVRKEHFRWDGVGKHAETLRKMAADTVARAHSFVDKPLVLFLGSVPRKKGIPYIDGLLLFPRSAWLAVIPSQNCIDRKRQFVDWHALLCDVGFCCRLRRSVGLGRPLLQRFAVVSGQLVDQIVLVVRFAGLLRVLSLERVQRNFTHVYRPVITLRRNTGSTE